MLAMYLAARSHCRVQCLATFAPPEPQFLAHPVAFMQMQARALGLPHHLLTVREPAQEGYEAGLRWLRDSLGVDTLITGDIAEVAGQPNWIRERGRSVGLKVLTPLWGQDRLALLRQMLAAGFKVVFSCVKTPWLSPDWVGRELDDDAVAELCTLREQNGLDLCGEQGEYHTLVTDGPQFQSRIQICACSRRCQQGLVHLEIERLELAPK